MARLVNNGAVVVTGASRGIGRATALLLARLGLTVYGTVRSEADAAQLTAPSMTVEIKKRVIPLLCDVTDAVAVAEAARRVWRDRGDSGLVGLVNNAGIARAGPLESLPIDAWREQFEVNVLGVVAMTRALLPLLRLGGGRIVNVSSSNGLVPIPFLGPYGTSKAALDHLSDILRLELRPWRIPVIVVQPGLVDTGASSRFLAVAEEQLYDAGAELRQLYAPHMARMHALARDRVGGGMPPERVAQAIARALLRRRPKRYYRVGWEPCLLAWLSRLAPRWLLEELSAWLLMGS